MFAASTQHIVRPVFHATDGTRVSRSQGVQLARAAALRWRRGSISCRTVTSPFNWPGPHLGTQVWFVARRRAARSEPLRLPRVAVVADLREERWHAWISSPRCCCSTSRRATARLVEATELRPAMVRRLTRLPLVGETATADTADRILNRVWDYPRWLRSRAGDFDLFHIIDHSYAHLATQLPAGRSLITCHDLDAFRGVLPGSRRRFDRPTGTRPATARRDESRAEDPVRERRPRATSWSRRRSFRPNRVVVVPNGVHPSYTSATGARRGSTRPTRFSVPPVAGRSSCCTSAARFRASASTCC